MIGSWRPCASWCNSYRSTAGDCDCRKDEEPPFSFAETDAAPFRDAEEPPLNRHERRRAAMLARLGDRASKHSLRLKWEARR